MKHAPPARPSACAASADDRTSQTQCQRACPRPLLAPGIRPRAPRPILGPIALARSNQRPRQPLQPAAQRIYSFATGGQAPTARGVKSTRFHSQISPPDPVAHRPDSWEAARTQVLLRRAPLLSALHKQSPHLRRHRPCPREKPSAHSQDHALGEHWVALCRPPASTHVPPEPEAPRESQYLADPREGFARRPS